MHNLVRAVRASAAYRAGIIKFSLQYKIKEVGKLLRARARAPACFSSIVINNKRASDFLRAARRAESVQGPLHERRNCVEL